MYKRLSNKRTQVDDSFDYPAPRVSATAKLSLFFSGVLSRLFRPSFSERGQQLDGEKLSTRRLLQRLSDALLLCYRSSKPQQAVLFISIVLGGGL